MATSINHVILKTVLSLIFLKVNENASDYVELDYDGEVYTLNEKTKSDECFLNMYSQIFKNRKLSESEHHAILFASLDYPFE